MFNMPQFISLKADRRNTILTLNDVFLSPYHKAIQSSHFHLKTLCKPENTPACSACVCGQLQDKYTIWVKGKVSHSEEGLQDSTENALFLFKILEKYLALKLIELSANCMSHLRHLIQSSQMPYLLQSPELYSLGGSLLYRLT